MIANDGYGPVHTGKLMTVFSRDSSHLLRIIDHGVNRNSLLGLHGVCGFKERKCGNSIQKIFSELIVNEPNLMIANDGLRPFHIGKLMTVLADWGYNIQSPLEAHICRDIIS